MVRTEAVAVVARVHHDGVLPYGASFQTSKDRADALIDQRDQPEVALFDAAVFVRCNPEKQLKRQSLSIQHRFSLLPFAHEAVPPRNIFAVLEGSGLV